MWRKMRFHLEGVDGRDVDEEQLRMLSVCLTALTVRGDLRDAEADAHFGPESIPYLVHPRAQAITLHIAGVNGRSVR